MSNYAAASLAHVPVELLFRIFDHLELIDLRFSLREVCTRLNNVIDIYHPYQVNFFR